MSRKPIITVIGSINMDLVTITKKFPHQGETVLGERFRTIPGGKGANQAIAAVKLGANVQFIGRVGDDPNGKELQEGLHNEGITTYIDAVPDESSGIATIIISEGDNRIIVTSGANKHVTPEYIDRYKEVLLKSDLVLMQFEIPLETVKYCLSICEENDIPVVLNPAPAGELEEEYWLKASYITPNETEAAHLFGSRVGDFNDPITAKMIITMGNDGATYMENGEFQKVRSFDVKVVDTTGAGDAFNGGLTVALAEGKPMKDAIHFANATAALSVQKLGARAGMPLREEVEEFLKNVKE